MATSGSINWALNRDDVIKLALRRIGAIGEGETPTSNSVTDAAVSLNALVKEYEAEGMPLWKLTLFSITPTATNSFTIGVGQTVNRYPPRRIHQMFYRNTSTLIDTPINMITRDEYMRMSNKSTLGVPTMAWYNPPGNQGGASQENSGVLTTYLGCDASFVANHTLQCVGEFQFEDFDASTDYPDFPSYFNNALAWGLAADLCYDYGVAETRTAQIAKRAEKAKINALMNSYELGSLFIQPSYNFSNG